MKAGWYGSGRRGSTEDRERPDLERAGEVRVRIACSGVNPSDVKRRAGWNNQKLAFPWQVPNNDGAGVIDKVGAGVDAKRVGERVWLHSTGWKRPLGTAAQYTVTPHHRAFPLPAGVSFEIGAGLGVPAMTAQRRCSSPAALARSGSTRSSSRNGTGRAS
jgi:NADPH2:quinone reductase